MAEAHDVSAGTLRTALNLARNTYAQALALILAEATLQQQAE